MQNETGGLETQGLREFRGFWRYIAAGTAILLSLYTIAYLLDIFSLAGIYIQIRIHQAIFLSLSLFLVFLIAPYKRGASLNKFPWYDKALALLGLIGPGYVALFIGKIQEQHDLIVNNLELLLGIITILLILEGSRRLVGTPFVVVCAAFLLYAKFTNYFPGIFHGKGYSVNRVTQHMYFSVEGIFGIPLELAASVIFVFILFGQLLYFCRAGQWFIELAQSLAGHTRGGPAKVAVIASGLFGTISGSPTANICTTGIITIPMMKRAGYKPHFAAAVETVASTGGSLMPPIMGAVAFILADYIQVPYSKVAIAAFLPAVLYYVALYFQVDGEAVLLGLKGMPRKELPDFKKTFLSGWYYLIPFAVLVYYMFVLNFGPAKSGLYATGALILVSVVSNIIRRQREFSPGILLQAIKMTGFGILIVTMATSASGILIGSVSLTGLGIRFSQIIISIAGGHKLAILVLAAIASTVMGMGLPVVPLYILLGILVAPALVETGVPLLAAHLFILYFGVLSFITPPVAAAVFVAAPMAGARVMQTGWQAMRLGIVAYIVPFMFVYSPALLLSGSVFHIVTAVITSLIGVMALAGGVEGCLFKRVNWLERILLIIAGIMLIAANLRSSLAGAIIIALILLHRWVAEKKAAKQAASKEVNDIN
ncbi:MAG: TRAP transporter fused permease subunit [Dehalococcoidia bacterium]|nr:TRAP transporter fused permease subunit [Dehalococcoidia bacterium]